MRISKFRWKWFIALLNFQCLKWTTILMASRFRETTKAMQALNVELGKLELDECDEE